MHREERVVAAFLGDGALNEGAFHESVNLASLWKVPIIFICENNQYGFSKQVSEVMANDDISSRVASYGIETVTIDGNDAELVYRTVERARDRAVRGVPQFLIFTTYRVSGHSKSDKNRYRSRKEIDSWRKRCPVTRLRNRLMSVYGIEESEIIRIEQGIIRHIEEAEQMALRAPEADPSVLAGLLYSDNGEVDHA
jgi:pyruvate dehydrogenase E1 component alpha subunit